MSKNSETAAYALFHYPYMWRIPENEMWNENETEYFGIHTTGSDDWDAKLATAKSDYYITTADAAYLADNGVAIGLVDPKDAVVIYKHICEHLSDWARHLRNGELLSSHFAPIAGLKKFNALAKALMPLARRNGLIEHRDAHRSARARRITVRGQYDDIDLSSINHSDVVMNKIVEYNRRQNGGFV